MNRSLAFAFIFVSPFFGILPASQQRPRQLPNHPPTIESFISSSRSIEICPFLSYGKPEVTLFVRATDPDNDQLLYDYSTSEGIISGEGKSVVWNLEGVPRGPHQIQVTVTDAAGVTAKASLTVTTVDAGVCDRPAPPCPVIKMSASTARSSPQE
jgi:hypothetical protein